MIKYALKIKLLSDTCCGTGEGNGATKDVLSTYDKYGLPYIPAKRIKGILRSNAIFLKEYGQCQQEEINQLFGEGTKEGALRIGNAQLVAQEKLVNIIQQYPRIFTPKAVERAYTTQRTATAIELETGVAKNQSLRTFGAIPKGEVFIADIWLDSTDRKVEQLLQNCVKLLRHIGLNRTRGYGEVKATITLLEQENQVSISEKTPESAGKKLTYRIELLTPVVSDLDYIAGSALQGVFASYLLRNQDDVYVNDFLTKVRFGNGYLIENGQQLLPVPLSVVKEKNKEGVLYSEIDGFQKIDAQYTKVSGYGLVVETEKFYHTDVKKRIDYHFTTEPDKAGNYDMTSEGNVDDNRGDLFTYSLIEEGQVFGGTINVEDASIAKNIVDSLNLRDGIIYLGRSSRVQYGKCRMTIVEQNEAGNASPEDLEDKEWVLEFLSDVILVDEEGVNLANQETLERAVKNLFNSGANIVDEAIYASTTVVAGYNAKWKLPKRRYQAFSKGTQIRVKGKPKNREGYIGLLQSEGYGAYRIRTISEINGYAVCKDFDSKKLDDVQRHITSTSDLQMLQWVIINEIKDYLVSQAHEFINRRKDVLSHMTATEANRLRELFRLMFNKELKEALANFQSYVKDKFTGSIKKLVEDIKKAFTTEMESIKKNKYAGLVDDDFWKNHIIQFFMTYIESCIWSITILKRKGGK